MEPQEDVVRLEQSTVSMNGIVVVVQHVPVPQVLEVTPLNARHVSVERIVTVIQRRLSKYDCYHTGCPNINKAVACCFSSATALFFLGHLV